MPLLDKKSVLAAKIETTPGTAESLAAANATMNVFNKRIIDQTEFIERMGQGAFGRIVGSHGARIGQATFETDLTPSTTTHPAWALAFLPACGLVASTDTYTPRTEAPGSNVKTLTIGLYTDGLYEQLHGCMGTFSIQFEAGRVPRIQWTFTGVYTKPSDVAILDPTYETTNPIRFVSSALAIGSYTPKIQSMSLDIGNQVVLREDSRSTTGFSYAVVTDRRPTLTLNPELDLVATAPYATDFENRTMRAISWAMSESNLGFSWSAPAGQLAGPPQPGNRGDIRTWELVYQLNKSDPTGDDELSWVFDVTA